MQESHRHLRKLGGRVRVATAAPTSRRLTCEPGVSPRKFFGSCVTGSVAAPVPMPPIMQPSARLPLTGDGEPPAVGARM
jgi:hypothetical protein